MKRIIVCLIIISMLPNFKFPIVCAQSTANYNTEIQLLQFLNVVPLNEYTSDELSSDMSYLQFIQYVKKLFKFDDVYKDNEFNELINIDDLGIKNIEESVDVKSTVVILLKCLGYEQIANANGGYPYGYFMLGESKTLLFGIQNIQQDRKLTMGEVFKVLYNLLKIQYAQFSMTIGNIKLPNPINKGETILSYVYGYQKKSGIVTGDKFASLYKTSTVNGDNQILIDVIPYYMGCKYPADLLGSSVVFYVSIDEPDKILYIEKDVKKNTEIQIRKDQFYSYKNSEIQYYEDEKARNTTRAILAKNACIIRNGAFYGQVGRSSINEDVFNINSGSITLVDNDGNGQYDVVRIKDFKTYVVDRFDVNNEIIYDQYNNDPLYLSNDDKSQKLDYRIFIDGKEGSIDDIKEWAVLSVAEAYYDNSTEKKIDIYIINKKVNGIIEEIGPKDESLELTIDGATYKVADNYYKNGLYQKGTMPFDIGKSVEAYLNSDGYIAAVTAINDSSIKTGYLVGVGKKSKIDSLYEFIIFEDDTKTGVMKTYDGTSNIRVNKKKDSQQSILNSLIALGNDNIPIVDDNGNNTYNQLVKYKVNGKGQITEIQTATWSTEPNLGVFSLNQISNVNSSFNKYMYRIDNSKTRRYLIPKDLSDEANYYILLSSNYDYDGTIYDRKIYNIDNYYMAEAYVCRLAQKDISGNLVDDTLNQFKSLVNNGIGGSVFNTACVVESSIMTLDENGDSIYNLNISYFGYTQKFTVTQDVLNKCIPVNTSNNYNSPNGFRQATIKKGDIIMMFPSIGNKLKAVYLVYSTSENVFYDAAGGKFNRGYAVSSNGFWRYGKIVEYNDNQLYVDVNGVITRFNLDNRVMRVGEGITGALSINRSSMTVEHIYFGSDTYYYDDLSAGSDVVIGWTNRTMAIIVFK